MNKEKKPLYRKINRTPVTDMWKGGEYRWDRAKHKKSDLKFEKMIKRGKGYSDYDYAPLYYFLLSKVGQDWTAIHSEAVSRLPNIKDGKEHVWDIVFRPYEYTGNPKDMCPYTRYGDDSYYSTLYIDENNILRKVDPDFHVEKLNNYYLWGRGTPTFNGKRIMNHNTDNWIGSCLAPQKPELTLQEDLEERISALKQSNSKIVDCSISFKGKEFSESLTPDVAIKKYGFTKYYTLDYDNYWRHFNIKIKDKKIIKDIKEWKITGVVETYCSFKEYNADDWQDVSYGSDFSFFYNGADKNKFTINKIIRADSKEDALTKVRYGNLKQYILKEDIKIEEH